MNSELTIIDIRSLVEIIDVMAQRGAIKGEELQHVANLRNKLISTLNSAIQTDEDTGTE